MIIRLHKLEEVTGRKVNHVDYSHDRKEIIIDLSGPIGRPLVDVNLHNADMYPSGIPELMQDQVERIAMAALLI